MFSFMQLGSLLAETLYIWGSTLIVNNISTLIFPHVVYNTYVIVNCVIVISYLTNMKMQEMLVRWLNFLHSPSWGTIFHGYNQIV